MASTILDSSFFEYLSKLDMKTFQKLLEKECINLHMRDETGGTLLHYAAFHNRGELMEFLIDSGVDVNACNDCGKTPQRNRRLYVQTSSLCYKRTWIIILV